MKNPKNLVNTVIGWAVLGVLISGGISLIAALVLFVLGEAIAAGICLVAAALAFGLLAQATLRS